MEVLKIKVFIDYHCGLMILYGFEKNRRFSIEIFLAFVFLGLLYIAMDFLSVLYTDGNIFYSPWFLNAGTIFFMFFYLEPKFYYYPFIMTGVRALMTYNQNLELVLLQQLWIIIKNLIYIGEIYILYKIKTRLRIRDITSFVKFTTVILIAHSIMGGLNYGRGMIFNGNSFSWGSFVVDTLVWGLGDFFGIMIIVPVLINMVYTLNYLSTNNIVNPKYLTTSILFLAFSLLVVFVVPVSLYLFVIFIIPLIITIKVPLEWNILIISIDFTVLFNLITENIEATKSTLLIIQILYFISMVSGFIISIVHSETTRTVSKYNFIMSSQRDPYILLNNTNVILYVNESFCTMFNFKSEDTVDKKIEDIQKLALVYLNLMTTSETLVTVDSYSFNMSVYRYENEKHIVLRNITEIIRTTSEKNEFLDKLGIEIATPLKSVKDKDLFVYDILTQVHKETNNKNIKIVLDLIKLNISTEESLVNLITEFIEYNKSIKNQQKQDIVLYNFLKNVFKEYGIQCNFKVDTDKRINIDTEILRKCLVIIFNLLDKPNGSVNLDKSLVMCFVAKKDVQISDIHLYILKNMIKILEGSIEISSNKIKVDIAI